MYDAVHDVVGISGGSFAVAALSRHPSQATRLGHRPADQPGDEPDDRHVALLRRLLEALEGAGSKTRSILGIVATAVVALAAVGGIAAFSLFRHQTNLATLWLIPIVIASSFLIRAAATLRWKWILRGVYGTDTMAPTPAADEPGRPGRRFAIGATGLSDGYLYSFTSSPSDDIARWRA